MIILDYPKFVKRKKGNIYLKSRGVDKALCNFCDYSKEEHIVEIEYRSGERIWHNIKQFFYDYNIAEEKYVGLLKNNIVKTYKVKSIESKMSNDVSCLYALLIPVNAERKFNVASDYPLTKDEHDLAL